MSAWEFEVGMCCGMQVEALQKKLQQAKDDDNYLGTVVDSGLIAARQNESLFDSITMVAKIATNGATEVTGKITYWHPVDSFSSKSTTIATFKNIDACLDWLSQKSMASADCLNAFRSTR